MWLLLGGRRGWGWGWGWGLLGLLYSTLCTQPIPAKGLVRWVIRKSGSGSKVLVGGLCIPGYLGLLFVPAWFDRNVPGGCRSAHKVPVGGRSVSGYLGTIIVKVSHRDGLVCILQCIIEICGCGLGRLRFGLSGLWFAHSFGQGSPWRLEFGLGCRFGFWGGFWRCGGFLHALGQGSPWRLEFGLGCRFRLGCRFGFWGGFWRCGGFLHALGQGSPWRLEFGLGCRFRLGCRFGFWGGFWRCGGFLHALGQGSPWRLEFGARVQVQARVQVRVLGRRLEPLGSPPAPSGCPASHPKRPASLEVHPWLPWICFV